MYHLKLAIEGHHDVMCLQISDDDMFVAAGCADGVVRCYSTKQGKENYDLDTMHAQAIKLPATCLRFRPHYIGARAKNMAVVGTAAGTIEHWHLSSRRCVHSVKLDTEVYCLDYRGDGLQFAASGKDAKLRIFDEENKTAPLATLFWAECTSDRDQPAPAHSSRVQAVKWIPHTQHMLVTGGWDTTVQLWDTRVDHAVSSIYGPYICGDAIAVTRDATKVITASCRDKQQIEVWDLANPTVPCDTFDLQGGAKPPCHFYTAALSSNSMLAAGGTSELLLYPRVSSAAQPQALLPEGGHAVFSVCFSSTSSLLAAGGAQGTIRLYEPNTPSPSA